MSTAESPPSMTASSNLHYLDSAIRHADRLRTHKNVTSVQLTLGSDGNSHCEIATLDRGCITHRSVHTIYDAVCLCAGELVHPRDQAWKFNLPILMELACNHHKNCYPAEFVFRTADLVRAIRDAYPCVVLGYEDLREYLTTSREVIELEEGPFKGGLWMRLPSQHRRVAR